MNHFTKQDVIPESIQTFSQENLAERGIFYVGGEYVPCGEDFIMTGQMYVEVYVPKKILHKYPLVLIHGNAQTGSCFIQTLEGKAGWLNYFLSLGCVVYLADQPERGRSICHSDINGPRIVLPAKAIASQFSSSKDYPGAEKHTQWPGNGEPGDPIFDSFYMSQVDSLSDLAAGQRLIQKAGAALLDTIGPAVIICHSQAGPFAWILANERPKLVKAAVAIEPSGPPFVDIRNGSALVDEHGCPLNYGISYVPLEFEPPLSSPSELRLSYYTPETPGKQAGYLQAEPARKLKNLTHIPMLVMSAEASYHTPYDYLTAKFLEQAGVPVEYMNLGDTGVHGNGHMMMIEKNSDQAAGQISEWLANKNF